MKHLNLVIILLLGFMVSGFSYKVKSPIEKKVSTEYRNKMIEGTLAITGHFKHVNQAYVVKLVDEVIAITSQPGNRWMLPHILLGLAINESDLCWWITTGSRTQPDCGICQNHTPLFARSQKARWSLCAKLNKSTKLSFKYAMKELNPIRRKWCLRYFPRPIKHNKETSSRFNKRIKRWKNNQHRCILNLYNQGPRYLKGSCEKRISKTKNSPREYRRKVRYCKWRNLYWLRSLCFSKGLELGKKPNRTCRKADSLCWINKVYKKR